MRLEELFLDGFGHFNQHSIGPVAGPVTVFYGPNEAGKSTLLAFIRTVLFGFPLRGRRDYYPPLSGGRHGGRIRLSDDSGVVYTLERYAGARGGPATVRTDAGEILDTETALLRLTGQATPDLFNNVFAFSIDELQEVRSLNDPRVSGIIYSAGQGAPKLPDLSKSLSDRRADIFQPRGSAQAVPRLVRELQVLDQQLREIQGNAERYGRLTARREEIRIQTDAAVADVARLNSRAVEIRNLISGWEDWVELANCDARLKEMPRFEKFPEDPILRLETLEERTRQVKADMEDASEQLRLTGEAASAVIPGEELLQHAARIEDIRRSSGSFDSSVHDLPERQDELREMEDSLSVRLRALGDGWDESNIESLDTSMTVHDEVDGWKRQLADADRRAEDSQVRLDQENGRLDDLRKEEQEAQDRLRSGPVGHEAEDALRPASGRLEDLIDDRDRMEQIRRGRGSFDDSVRDLPERRAELTALESDLGDRLRDLGQGWDEARLENFDTSIVLRQQVEGWKDTLAWKSDDLRQSRQRLEQEKSGLTERQTAAREARERLPDAAPLLDAAELTKQRSALRASRGHLNEYERARLNHENLRGQLNSLTGGQGMVEQATRPVSLLLPALLVLAGIVLMAAGVYLGSGAALLGFIGGLALLAVAGYLVVRGRSSQVAAANPLSGALSRQTTAAEASEESARRLLVEAAQPLGIDHTPNSALLDNAETRLGSAEAELTAWNQANERADESERLMKSQEQRVEEAVEREKAVAAADTDARHQWREWLMQRGLSETFNPDTMIEFMGRTESIRARLEQVRQMRHRVRAIEVDTLQYFELVQPVASKYGIALGSGDHRRVMAAADTLIAGFDRVSNLVVQRDDVVRRLKHQEQTALAALDDQHTAAESLADRQAAWRGWLQERGLRDTFTPDTMLEFLARVETARGSLAETHRMRDRVAAIEEDIDEFFELVAPMASVQGLSLDPQDRRQLSVVADTLINSFDETKALLSDRERAKEQEEEGRRLLERQQQRLKAVQQEQTALLSAGGADNPEDFRVRARQHRERLDLERQRSEFVRSLERLSGPGERYDAFREALAGSDLASLNDEVARLSERMSEMEAVRNSLLEERGGIDTELAQLTSEEESSALRIRRSTLLEQLQEHAREWSRLTIAESLLERTRLKFEQERQPGVIQHAQGFFSNITGGRYQRLYAPIGQQTITVTDPTGGGKQPEELSRGTREQLYLALRFGLVREFGEHAERLPVVVDEALVNFDPDRARLAAGSFAQLAETNQVLVFTCHPATTEMFADVAGAQVVDISRTYSEAALPD